MDIKQYIGASINGFMFEGGNPIEMHKYYGKEGYVSGYNVKGHTFTVRFSCETHFCYPAEKCIIRIDNERIFTKEFIENMQNNDYNSFKANFPTLLTVILSSMDKCRDNQNIPFPEWLKPPKPNYNNECDETPIEFFRSIGIAKANTNGVVKDDTKSFFPPLEIINVILLVLILVVLLFLTGYSVK